MQAFAVLVLLLFALQPVVSKALVSGASEQTLFCEGCTRSSMGEGTDNGGSRAAVSGRELVVKSLPPVRQPGPPPEPVPVQHSPTYLLRNRVRQARGHMRLSAH
jgi:hypothetical protein